VPGQCRHDLHLQLVDVLILVDEDVIKPGGQSRARVRVAGQRTPEEQQVVQVDHPESPFARGVGAKQAGHGIAVLGTPRKRLLDHLPDRTLRVDRARVDVGESVVAREPPPAVSVTLLLTDQVDQVRGVTGVQQAEVHRQAQRRGVTTHKTVRHRMKGPAGDPPGAAARMRPGQRHRSADHLASRAAGEGQQQNPLRRGAVLDQTANPRAQCRRLPGPRARQDQQVTTLVLRRGPLLWIQIGEPRRLRWALQADEHRFAEPRPRPRQSANTHAVCFARQPRRPTRSICPGSRGSPAARVTDVTCAADAAQRVDIAAVEIKSGERAVGIPWSVASHAYRPRLCWAYRFCQAGLASTVDVAIWRSEMVQ
jgi:hypothetical protein